MTDEGPLDPFHGDPSDPAAALDDDAGDELPGALTPAERDDVLADIEDLDVFEAVLAPRDVRGIVVDCEDCDEPHYFGWDLLRGNFGYLLDSGMTRMHEPAYQPDPAYYVSWEYARGFADGLLARAAER